MNNAHTTRLGGICLAAGGVLLFIGDALHPTGGGPDYQSAVAWQMTQPTGPIASWLVLAGMFAVSWGVWMLLDSAWKAHGTLAQAGARLVVLAGVYMAVQSVVELAMRAAASEYAAGVAVPMVALRERMYASGLPALMLGVILLVAGLPAAAPIVVRIIGIVGAVSLALAGPLVDGMHHLALWPLYLGGVLSLVWIVWVGVALASCRSTKREAAVRDVTPSLR